MKNSFFELDESHIITYNITTCYQAGNGNGGIEMLHKEELIRIQTIIKEAGEDLQEELKNLPDGELTILRRGDRRFYYQHFPKTGNRKKAKSTGITNDTDTIMGLVRKRYIEKAIQVIDKDMKVLDIAIRNYQPFDEESLMAEYVKKNPGLEAGIYHGMQSDEAWADDYKRQKDLFKEQLIYTSAKGVPMRSLGEVYIASRLDHYGIPYRYEASIPHPDVSRIPDFTIRRPRDGKIIYWEHMGLPDDESYMQRNDLKFVEYENAGIVPWDNLIVTYNMESGGYDAKIIEAMIQGWLL